MVKPYTQIEKNEFIIRTFDNNTEEHEFVWHRDKSNRIVIPLDCQGWKFQFDNELPQKIKPFSPIIISKNMYHRVIKGDSILKIYILEVDEIPDSGIIQKIISDIKNEHYKNI